MLPVDQWLTVVGVIENVRLDGLVDSREFRTVGAYYVPMEQGGIRSVSLSIRTSQEPRA